jgi:hypothetical protein
MSEDSTSWADDNDDHVDGVRLRLWTTVTTSLLFSLRVIYEHGEPWWNDIDSEKHLTCAPELSGIQQAE